DAETRQEKIKSEMNALEFQKKGAFKSPPKEWIDHRLENFYETLNKNTKSSALALKDLLGPIEMEPVQSDPIIENGHIIIENGHIIEQKPHYPAHSNIESLALLDQENKGANWLKWRTRSQPIRTLSRIEFKIQIQIHK
ncbi:MAG: hypothetical protein K1060chlam4_01036, partial [Candidatus Anoxychlamydiales bacterium]|nr:hypothetical protein [Candidatus Anoxychlamydiales bacterium]